MKFITSLLIGLGVLLCTARLAADSPLPPPKETIVKSPDGTITAISDPQSMTTLVQRTATGLVLWKMPGWERWLFVADDGKHVVTGYGGINLIPVDYDEKLVLFTFWNEGAKVREVTLKEFVTNKNILQRTSSHYYWGLIENIDKQGRLVVRRADEKVFLFDLSTGQQIK
jgi:hypothetical protein